MLVCQLVHTKSSKNFMVLIVTLSMTIDHGAKISQAMSAGSVSAKLDVFPGILGPHLYRAIISCLVTYVA